MNVEAVALLSELKSLYILLGILTIIGGIGGAFAAIKFGVSINKKDIKRHSDYFKEMFKQTNQQETRIAVLEDGIKGIRHSQDKQYEELKEIKNLIINGNRKG